MSKQACIETIKGFIKAQEEVLADMEKRAKLLNKAIPILRLEIENEKAKVQGLEKEL